MIPESFVQDLLARVDVVEVVGRYVQLRKGGANLLGLCPFHNEKSPSFTVSPTKQFYHCFGCGAHGSAISFLIEHTGASFPEAVRTLASTVGMTVPEEPRSPAQRAASQRYKAEVSRHQQVLESAQAHYLRELKAFKPAIRYLKERGISGQIASRYGLGWSGNDRRGLSKVFGDYEDALLVEAGLVIESEDGRRYDRFRERIMFPIRNARGNLIGFGGRIIGKGEPKYLNSPETPLFSKGRELYGFHEARAAIRSEGQVLVVEGYMDVVGLAQQGVENAVATLGTATTPEHIQKLLRASDKLIFSFDGDKAGRRAAWRALQACLPLMRDDVAVRFLFLPAEHDPDSYIREFGAEAFRATANEAMALSTFLLDELSSRHALHEAEGRAACVYEAKPLLSLLPQGALRVQIEREFARKVLLTPEELQGMLDSAPDRVDRPAEHPVAPEAGIVPFEHAAPDFDGFLPDDFSNEIASDGSYVSYEPFFEPGFAESSVPWESRGGSSSGGAKTRQFGKGRTGSRTSQVGTGRQGRNVTGVRTVTPMAKRLLRLLLAHPSLVDGMGEQQLEILEQGPHLVLVRDLIALANSSGARHVGALLQAADPDSDLAEVLGSISTELLAQDDLPDPIAEWNDALHRIELEAIKAEQSALIASGMKDEVSQQRYRKLTQRLALLSSARSG